MLYVTNNTDYKSYNKVDTSSTTTKRAQKAYMKNLATGGVFEFLFNPEGWDIDREVNYSEIKSPGSSYPKFQYVNGGAKTISFDLFLYGNNGECEKCINFLESFLPVEDSKSKFAKPPLMLFAFGIMIKKCIVTGYKRKHTMFRKDLGYRVVNVSLTLKVVA